MALTRSVPLARYVAAVVIVATTTAVTFPLRHELLREDIVMVFLMAIVLVALYLHRGPAMLAAALSVAAFDYFFVPTAFTFAVKDPRHLLTFGVMFTVGFVISTLAFRLLRERELSVAREARTRVLYELGREIRRARDLPATIAAAEKALFTVLGERVSIEVEATSNRCELSPLPELGLDAERRHFADEVLRQVASELERANLAREVQSAGLRARTEELRSALLSAVSHDLRTPLATITGTATMLRDGGEAHLSAEERRELVGAICEQADRLEHFVASLLDMTRVQAGVDLRFEWVPLEELVEATLTRYASNLADREVTVRMPDEPVLVRVDALLFGRVLDNVLENALKYTPEKSPIEISVDSGDGGISLSIADRGPGLPAGAHTAVFDKFIRGTHDVAGVGLGLAIARGIAEAHAGTITADNRPEGGAVFRVHLPVCGGPDIAPAGLHL